MTTSDKTESGCVVIGAGPGGLAATAMLERRGIDCIVLERGGGPGHKWRTHYDRLHVNTSTLTSFLPRRRFPLRYGRWPSKDQIAAYYADYAERHRMDIRVGVEAINVDRDPAGRDWLVKTSDATYRAPRVVIATSKDRTPVIPEWPGRDLYEGRLVHTSDYRNARPFRGLDVVVVGAGNSALDVCLDLVEGEARSVRLALRTPPHLTRRSVAGIPSDLFALASHRLPTPVIDRAARAMRRVSLGDLSDYGLPIPADGLATRLKRRGMIPAIDPGTFVPAVKAGRVEVVAGVSALAAREAVLEDGTRVPADAIVAGTGYRKDLESLVGHLGVLDEDGNPKISGGTALDHAPGLYFIGFTNVLAGNLRQIRIDAKRIAAAASAPSTR